MQLALKTFFATLSTIFRSRAALELENLALRHQIDILQRAVRKRPKLTPLDRLLWVWLSCIWSDWRSALAIVQPETVVAWHRPGEILSTPRSPWQRAYVERVIGSIRRECLDHLIVFNEVSLRRILGSYFAYYHQSRTHLSLAKDSPQARPIQPVEMGPVVDVPQVGGLHHRYERRAA